jgi:DNA-binding beta-propeller fold protein YncE
MSDASGVPRLARLIRVGGPLQGEALTHDGRYLLVADGGGAAVLSVARAQSGSPGAVLGLLGKRGPAGAIQVSVSPDDRFAFVELEYARTVESFDLRVALAAGLRDGYVGAIPLGYHPVGMAISPDGRWLYAVSEVGADTGGQGGLSLIDLHRAETAPARAVVATVGAGCDPARVTVSPDGRTVWATARDSNVVLGWSAAKLASDPSRALTAVVRVGQSPVGLAFVDSRRLVVSDSDRFRTPERTTGLTVIDVGVTQPSEPMLRGTIAAGRFPREMALAPDGRTLLVNNFDSAQVEVLSTAEIP